MKKICKECGEFKEYHAKGLCVNCYQKEWRKNNLEKVKKTRRKYKINYPEKVKISIKKWKNENSEHTKEYNKKWTIKNAEHIKIYSKNYRIKNAEKIHEYRRKYYLDNPEKVKNWAKNNPDKRRESHRKWHKNNPDKSREKSLKRRGYDAPENGIIKKVINENVLKYGIIRCEKCKEPCPDNFHIDHINPLSKGGSSNYNNLQILCAKCNREKYVAIVDYRQNIEKRQFYLREI